MFMKAYSIRDSKALTFNQPFFKRTHGEAERDFTELTNDGKSFISKYPDDFDLYFVGEYDEQNGIFKSLDTPHHIAKAVNLRKV